jgi:hypothetical protein
MDCLNGHCSDGYCCNADCSSMGGCFMCNLTGVLGKCTAVLVGSLGSCMPMKACNDQNMCVMTDPMHIANGDTCGGGGTACLSGNCVNNAGKSCQPNQPNGAYCTTSSQCTNGNCVNFACQ